MLTDPAVTQRPVGMTQLMLGERTIPTPNSRLCCLELGVSKSGIPEFKSPSPDSPDCRRRLSSSTGRPVTRPSQPRPSPRKTFEREARRGRQCRATTGAPRTRGSDVATHCTSGSPSRRAELRAVPGFRRPGPVGPGIKVHHLTFSHSPDYTKVTIFCGTMFSD